MKRAFAALFGLALAAAVFAGKEPEKTGEVGLENKFRSLPMEARRLTGPLFWLHGDESRERLEEILAKVEEGGNGTFTAESRPHNDWLGEGWWRDLKICLDFAKAHDLTMWIFDEEWWPSGEVGGRVPEKFGGKYLVAKAWPASATVPVDMEHLVAVIAGKQKGEGIDGESLVDLTAKVSDGRLEWSVPEVGWSVMVFEWKYAPKRNGNVLVDGASQEAVDWYLNYVYQPHYDHFKDDFGKTIVGFFYDEPETWGDWGTETIPMLKERGIDWKRALVAYKFQLAGEEDIAAKYQYQDALAESWGRTMFGGITDWCRAHNVTSIGHFLEHQGEYLSRRVCAGNMFQLQKYTDMGGIDEVYTQIVPGQRRMGSWQMGKLGSSISHVYGKRDDLTMVEIFGARGQDLTYLEMKWITDHMLVSGVNFFIPHSFNPRAPFDKDCPPYFYNGGYEPRWPLYRVYADYVSRASLLLSGGRHEAPIAFLFLGQSAHAGRAVRPEKMTTALQDALFDSDWMPYDVFENDTSLEDNEISLHDEKYQVLIVPPVEVIPYGALEKAKEFFERGGVVIGYGFLPEKSATLGKTSSDIEALVDSIWGSAARPGLSLKKKSEAGGRSYLLPEEPTPEQLQQVLTGDAGIHPTLEVVSGKTDHWLHVIHRIKDGMDVFFIANQNLDGGSREFKFRVTARGEPECWDPMRNEISVPHYQSISEDIVEIDLALESYQSVLLVFNSEKRPLPFWGKPSDNNPGKIKVRRESPDYPRRILLKPKTAAIYYQNFYKTKLWIENLGEITLSPVGFDYYHGLFEVPSDVFQAATRFDLVCEGITPEPAAWVMVNGQYAGGFIGRPLRLTITDLVKPGANALLIQPFAPASVTVEVY